MFKPYEELTEIEKVERNIFILECKDHWDNNDWNRYRELQTKLKVLKNSKK